MAGKTVTLTLNLTANAAAAQQALEAVGNAAAAQGAKIKAMGGGGVNAGAASGGISAGQAIAAGASSPIGGLIQLGVAAGIAAAALKAVSLASPGTIERLNIAFEDTLAVIG